MSRLRIVAAFVGLAALGQGCRNCPNERLSKELVAVAKMNYDQAKFSDAKNFYMHALEACPESYDAMLGLGHACREYGNELYRVANQLSESRKNDQAKKKFEEASTNHRESDQFFRTALMWNSDDVAPHYGLALLSYHRAVAPIAAPWAVGDTKQRQAERDMAIGEFNLVIKRRPDLVLNQAHRYRGLLLFTAGRTDEARSDLKRYHDYQQNLYNQIVQWADSTPEGKKRKDTALGLVEKEIDDVREVLLVHHGELQRERDMLTSKGARTPQEEQQLANIAREQLDIENMMKAFFLTRLGPAEQELKKRCDEYLDLFNRGAVDQVLSWLAPREGGEAPLQKGIQEKLRSKTQYANIVYTAIAIPAGEIASVGLRCDLVTDQGKRPDTEITLRWKRVDGQWLVYDHP